MPSNEKWKVEIVGTPLDVNECVQIVSDDCAGAISSFVGVTRNNFNGKVVSKLEYECYTPMSLKRLDELCAMAFRKWNDLLKIAIKHRTGTVRVGEPSVIIAVSSAHREASLNAVKWLIDELKATVPIWKKEFFEDGEVWKEYIEQRLKPSKLGQDRGYAKVST